MADKRVHEVRIGTSGWNYPLAGYGSWTGVFYPLKHGQKIPGTKDKFDELAYYAERFDTACIELCGECIHAFRRSNARRANYVVG